MNEKILLVDDETNVLRGYQRHLHRKFEVVAVESAAAGLVAMREQGPFAVVVSDYSMPEMDGIQFLVLARQIEENTVRIMITGYADAELAINAVNEGNIFRFLAKPCFAHNFMQAVTAGVEHYRLLTAEHELLNKTLKGSIKVLFDILSIVSPTAFGQATNLSRLAKELALRLNIKNPGEVELTATLSQIGCVAVPEDIFTKKAKGIPLTKSEEEIFFAHPQTGKKLLSNIPRLEETARAIEYQFKQFDGGGPPNDNLKGTAIPLTARILKVAIDFTFLTHIGKTAVESLELMRENQHFYDPAVFTALEAEVMSIKSGFTLKRVMVKEVWPGALLAADIKDRFGAILIPKNFEITEALKMRLLNFARSGAIEEPIKVLQPVAQPVDEK